MKKPKTIFFTIIFVLFFISRLVSQNIYSKKLPEEFSGMKKSGDFLNYTGPKQLEIIRAAFDLLGKKNNEVISIRDRKICLDCSGSVNAVFYLVGMDLLSISSGYSGTGVQALYKSLDDLGRIYKKGMPKPADLIFWSNTWDANGDGNNDNDPLTHVGLIIKTREDGTIYYLHSHIKSGLIIQKMNLYNKEYYSYSGEKINDAMAMGSYYGSEQNPENWTSGQLWTAFGDTASLF